MPKELVHDDLSDYDSEFPTQEGVVQVSWGREASHVQIATTLVEQADHSPVTREVEGGWYVNLNRAGINDLIRYLRRARDQAFGRDE